MPSARPDDHNSVVRRINATLQGPVMDALGDLVPEIRNLPRRERLEALLDNVDLLHRCFLAFRTHPDHFRHLLVNRHKVAVEDAEALLECGRSLDQVIAMVVRTAAKRHFRRRLDGTPRSLRVRPRRNKRRKTLLNRLSEMLAPPPRVTRISMPRSRADALYEVFQDYLLHDWQVPMIPEYSQLSPGVVRQLGARILDYRIAEDIRRLRVDPDNPPPPTPLVEPAQQELAGTPLPNFLSIPKEPDPLPAAVSMQESHEVPRMAPLSEEPADITAKDERARLSDILSPDGKHLKGSAFALELLDPEVRSAIPDSEQTVRITGLLGSVNSLAGKLLVGELGLRSSQLAVFLLTAHAALGDRRFEIAFGVPGRPDYMARVVERAKLFKIDQTTPLPAIAAFVTKSFKAAS